MIHFCRVLVAFFCLSLPANAALIDNGDGTVTDTIGYVPLMWEKYYITTNTSLGQANIHIEQLNWDKYSNWRFPTTGELGHLHLSGGFWVQGEGGGLGCGSRDEYDPGFSPYPFCQSAQIIGVRNFPTEIGIHYSQSELDQAILRERSRWDANGDNKIGLPEAIRALQIISGMR